MKSRGKSPAGRLGLTAALLIIAVPICSAKIPARQAANLSPPAGQVSGGLPLAFEANQGQTDPRVRFLARGPGHTLFLTADEAVLVLREAAAAEGDESNRGPRPQAKSEGPSHVVRMRFLGGDAPGPVGLDTLPGRSNYLVGSDPRRWHGGIPLYARVKYESLYPGVDAIFHQGDGRLEYDLVVAPGASPDVIRIGFEGTGRVRLDASGNLILPVGKGEVVQHAPVIYQETGGVRSMLAGRFVLRGRSEIGFSVSGTYDPARPLVIDPVLSYSTFLGGAASGTPLAMVVDGSGSVYFTGATDSVLPLGTALQPLPGGDGDVFVTRMDPSGAAVIYSTYLGGSEFDRGWAIALDGSGSAFVTGSTWSTDFPVVHAFQAAMGSVPLPGGNRPSDAFVAKLSPDGSALDFSTYLGGSNEDFGTAIAVDASGRASVAGSTGSGDFPVASPLQANHASFGLADAFITRFSASGEALVFSTTLGGQDREDGAAGIALDPAGNTYVTGFTNSPDFPQLGALSKAPDQIFYDAFVTKINPSGTGFIFSALLGGNRDGSATADYGTAIAADASGNAYVAGSTTANRFPIRNPVQVSPPPGETLPSGWNVFAAKINPTGTTLVYSTFLGGSSSEVANGIAVDAEGQAHLVGYTTSADFPQVRPLSPIHFPGSSSDLFVAKLSADGGRLAYSTCVGGTQGENGFSIAIDASGRALVGGDTSSPDFPVAAGPSQPFGPPAPFILTLEDDAPPLGPTPAPGEGRVENDHPAVHYDGPWFPNVSEAHSGGSAALAVDPGSRAVITFKGIGVRWIGYRDEWSGYARVYLDGIFVRLVDTHANSAWPQALLYAEGGLADENHTLVIEATGASGGGSLGAWVWVDAFEVIGGVVPPPDTDGDTVFDDQDCTPADSTTWRVPTQALSLLVSGGETGLALAWQAPIDQGGTAVTYDVLRSALPADFMSAECVATSLTTTSLTLTPGSGNEFYLVRSRNACGATLGSDSAGIERSGAACP